MAPVRYCQLLKRANGKAKGCLPNEDKARSQAREPYRLRQMFDDMAEENLRHGRDGKERRGEAEPASWETNESTWDAQCIRKESKTNGKRRPVQGTRRRREADNKAVYAPCLTCRAEIRLELNKNGKLVMPVLITAGKHLQELRSWAKWRMLQDDQSLAEGVPVPETACAWRKVARGTENYYKTRAEEVEAEYDERWLTGSKDGAEDGVEIVACISRLHGEVAHVRMAEILARRNAMVAKGLAAASTPAATPARSR